MATAILKKCDIPFTQVANAVLVNPEISAMAKGIYCYLCSKPDGWQFYNDTISREIKESVSRFRSAINELIDAGVIVRRQFKDDKTNKFGGNVYEIVDLSRIREKPHTEKTAYGKTITQSNTDIISNTENIEKEMCKERPQRGPSDISVTANDLYSFWNDELLPGRDNVARIRTGINQGRIKNFHKLLKLLKDDQKLETYEQAFELFKEQITYAYDNSRYLQGKAPGKKYKFTLDFCLSPQYFSHMVDGNYDD